MVLSNANGDKLMFYFSIYRPIYLENVSKYFYKLFETKTERTQTPCEKKAERSLAPYARP